MNDDRLADLTAAFDEVEGDETDVEDASTDAAEDEPEEHESEGSEEGAGDDSEGDDTDKESARDDKSTTKLEEKVDRKKEDKAEKKAATEKPEKPPVSWKAQAREAWKDVPPTARAEIVRREKEVNEVLNKSATARKFSEEFNGMIQPFMPFIAAERSSPLQATRNMMEMAAGLRVGTAQQKAAIVHEIITRFGVDVDSLDRMLVGEAPKPVDSSDIDRIVTQRVQQQLRQLVPDNSHQQEAEVHNTIQSFASVPEHEFFEDVREDMGLILATAAQNGKSLSMKQAYDKAVAMNDSVQSILTERKVRNSSEASRVARRKRAASSLRTGSPGGDSKAAGPRTRTDDILSAWDAIANRD